ncbi:hypothetical protein [Nevskia sp.]|uniref:hypothetical protein n=1 Tax=Nevskia sp. TaxID=1929292 RepID=UPI0025CC0697|nr:hypothetical protein [Nevskia sp.]
MRVLEFNDAALTLADADRIHATSPGFAFLDGRKLVFGEAARQQFRAQPRKTQFRYWYQLDQAPLDSAFGDARNHADLAWAQLSGIQANGGDGALLLAVPASFDSGQLGLLLALARAAKLDAVGLVDAAVAAASTVDAKATMLHLDVQLHRWWLTRMRAGSDIARTGGEDLAKPGLLAVWDACAGVIAEAFVRQTRFDPLHSAATEQALYERLPNWLAQFGRGAAVTLELPAGLRSHRASLPADALNGALAAISSRIAAGIAAAVTDAAQTAVLLSARAAAVPGLIEAIHAACGVRPQALDAQAVTRGTLAHAERIRADGEALPFVTRLPASGPLIAAAAVVVDTAKPAPPPTHLLVDDLASPLPSKTVDGEARLLGLKLRVESGRHLLVPEGALRIDGRVTTEPTRLSTGQLIETASGAVRVIHVLGPPA